METEMVLTLEELDKIEGFVRGGVLLSRTYTLPLIAAARAHLEAQTIKAIEKELTPLDTYHYSRGKLEHQAKLDAANAEIERLREALKNCADDLEAELGNKFELDIGTVEAARAALGDKP
jgi:hypothetical protein